MNTGAPRKSATALALALGLLAANATSAQVSTSSLAGKAADTDTVTIRGVDNGFERDIKVEDGRFQIRRIPIGVYEVVITHADGSVEAPILVRARVGSTTRVN